MRGIALVVAFALTVAPACSLLTVRGAPSRDPGTRPIDCTRSRFAPIVDTVPAVVLLGTALAVLADISGDDANDGDAGRTLAGGLVVIVFGVPGLPFAGSAWYGYAKTGRCRRMNAAPLPAPPPPGYPTAPVPMTPSGPPGGA